MSLISKYLLFAVLIFPSGFSISNSKDQPGGRDLPAEGSIHALFIFAQFAADNYLPGDSRWPKGDMPERVRDHTWVDSKWSENATPWSLTDYFNQMSFDK